MDPNKALENLRELVKTINKDYEDPDGNGVDQDDAAEIAGSFEALDAWLLRAGALPRDWQKASDEDLFTSIDRILSQNESLCCDVEDDRRRLALALCMGLQKPG